MHVDISNYIERQEIVTEAEKKFSLPLDTYKLIEISDTTDDSDAFLIAYNNEGQAYVFHGMEMNRDSLPNFENGEIVQIQYPHQSK